MWQHYRKTFIPTQILIVFIGLALALVWKVPPTAVLMYVVLMELFAVVGAIWGASLKRRMLRNQTMLHDDRR